MVWRTRNVLGSRVITDYLSPESSEGEFVEEEKPWPPPGRASRPRRRTARLPRPHSHLFRTADGKRIRGNKSARRWENSMFLSSLHQIPEEELAQDSTILPPHTSSFARLFTNDKCMQIWCSFTSRSEEEQQHILSPARREKEKEGDMEESGEERFRRIDHRVRSILQHNKHLPLGLLREVEEELSFLFSVDHRLLVVMLQTSPYCRLLLHGICQYMGLQSTTEKCGGGGGVVVVVECRANQFTAPEQALADFIEHKR